jgi:hypothetical protein
VSSFIAGSISESAFLRQQRNSVFPPFIRFQAYDNSMAVLLQQMERMMGPWDGHGEDKVVDQIQRLEISRAVLNLFVSGSGIFRPVLEKLLRFLFGVLDNLFEEDLQRLNNSLLASENSVRANSLESMSQDAITGRQRVEEKMRALVRDADLQRVDHELVVQRLESEIVNLQGLLKHQMMITHKASADEIRELIKRAGREKTIDEMGDEIKELKEEVADAQAHLEKIRDVNSKYAIQAVELCARLKAVTSQNEKLSASLTLQIQELSSLEQENEKLRMDVASLQKLYKVLSESSGKVVSEKTRPVRLAFGDNANVMAPLAFRGMVNRRVLPREVVKAIACDIVNGRHAQQHASFAVYLQSYFARKYGYDAVSYVYGMEEGTRAYDGDIDINIFGHVMRGTVPDFIYLVLATEIQLFMEACDLIDCIGGGSPTLSLPIVHVCGVLFALYPGYAEASYNKFVDGLTNLQTSSGFIHYGALFGTPAATEAEHDTSTMFSCAFKEAFLDDCLVTTQHATDLMTKNVMVSIAEATNAVIEVFEDESSAAHLVSLIHGVLQEGTGERYDTLMPSLNAANIVRQRLVLRRGAMRTTQKTNAKEGAWKRVLSEWRFATDNAHLTPVNYTEIANRCKTKRLIKVPTQTHH